MGNLDPAALGLARNAPLRVLVVDDNDLVRHITVTALVGEGHTVSAAPGADEALALVDAQPVPFDLLVTDIVLGRMNGYELAARIAADTPGIPVLVTSGYAPPATLAPIHGAGAVSFLQKPYTLDALARLVRELAAPVFAVA
jgi:CheY-like chemotaxis protein